METRPSPYSATSRKLLAISILSAAALVTGALLENGGWRGAFPSAAVLSFVAMLGALTALAPDPRMRGGVNAAAFSIATLFPIWFIVRLARGRSSDLAHHLELFAFGALAAILLLASHRWIRGRG